MDILIITHYVTEFLKEGTSRFVYLAEKLSGEHSVELITSKFDHFKKEKREGFRFDLLTKITLLDEPSYSKNVCLKRLSSHRYFGRQVKKYLDSRKKPDVIYCAVPSLECAYYAARYSQKNGVRFIIDIQDLWPEAFKMVLRIPVISDLIFYPMERKVDYIYSCADTIIGVSETYCSRAKRVNKKSAECVPVFLGTKLENFDRYALENKVERPKDKFILGYCGTLGHSYDLKCVFDAMVILREKGYDNISFWIMGDGPLKKEFEEYSLQRSLDTVFYGRIPYEKMCGLISSCDVCVNPIVATSAASIINKHGDYAASRLPTINTQTSEEYRDLLDLYKCGINCSPSSSVEIAEAIDYLISHEDEYEKMKVNAGILAREKFDREQTYKRICEMIIQTEKR